jgi:hypothetical protein
MAAEIPIIARDKVGDKAKKTLDLVRLDCRFLLS